MKYTTGTIDTTRRPCSLIPVGETELRPANAKVESLFDAMF